MTHLLLKQTVTPLAFRARDHPTYDVDARPKKGSVFESVLADGILAAHCRPNGKLGTSVERAAFGQDTSLLMPKEVARPSSSLDMSSHARALLRLLPETHKKG